MSEAFARIKAAFDAFRKRVETFEKSENVTVDFQDACESAYEGLYKFKERIVRELEKPTAKCDLTKEEKKFCVDLFKDKFLIYLLQLRTVATHIVSDIAIKEKSFPFFSSDGSPMELDCAASVNALFSNNIFASKNAHYGVIHINHRHNLRDAVKRIASKIHKFEAEARRT